ncbi:MAG: hypothetical protein CVV51_09865 [Spirochaetae bacterium HGW-Spirochaetae-7]|nr:MAG: hypothetical protein CVV51_09865 [Spirochaetae bacterium HGW-Spirochaetae-7]
MTETKAFDNDKYLAEQASFILERADRNEKLYLEFGGKLLWDYHAARVLPGYDPNVKMRLLARLKDRAEVVLCIHAGDIERKKLRGDFGITYDADALRVVDELAEWGVGVAGVVITRFDEQPAAVQFRTRLERFGVPVFTHRFTKGYPNDVDLIVSPEGYGANAYVPTTKPIVVITGPGPGSGKLATALTLLYHDRMAGRPAAYSKFETFPVWNLPLKHPVNVAYEAATAELGDFNCVDPFHLEAYGAVSINYNRDVEVFPVLSRMLQRMGTGQIYKSPTDMGVNRIATGIVDDEACKEAARQEVIRRRFRIAGEYALGIADTATLNRVDAIMESLDASCLDRRVVTPAREAAMEAAAGRKGHDGIFCGAAIELKDGRIITGKNSSLFHAASAVVLNTSKLLAGIPDTIHLLPPVVTESIRTLKLHVLERKSESLNLDEALVALAVSAAMNPAAQAAMEALKQLKGCELHLSHFPGPGDEAGLRNLGLNATSDATFAGKDIPIK